jgi:hypothetical protein
MHGQIPWGQNAWTTRDGHQGICRASGECLALPVSGAARRLATRAPRRFRERPPTPFPCGQRWARESPREEPPNFWQS